MKSAAQNPPGSSIEAQVLEARELLKQRRFLQTHGDHIEAMRLLGQIGMKLEVLDDAECLLESVLVFAPDYVAACYDYAVVLSQRHKHTKALEDRAEYEESFRYYERGNALKKSESRYSANALERSLRLQASICTREFFAARSGVGCDSAAPIFIVGLPRAGSRERKVGCPRGRNRGAGRHPIRVLNHLI